MMLIESFFAELNASGCDYFSFKGYHHLQEDILSGTGDIDIFVSDDSLPHFEIIAFKFGFFKATNRGANVHQYYGQIDGKLIMLDVVITIPHLDFSISNELRVSIRDFGIKSLINEDMIAYGMLHLYHQGDRDKYFLFIDYYLNDIKKEIYKTSIIYLKNKKVIDDLISDGVLAKKKPQKDYRYLFSRLLGFPNAKVMKKGLIVAMVGVDGAGKSTVIESIKRNSFYSVTGIKSFYMGGKDFWIPGLNTFRSKNKYVNLFINSMKSIDRQLRVLPAIFYRNRGYLVLWDRYFYDDEIDAINRINRGSYSKFQQLFKPKVRLLPDLAIYLNVSPEVAHSRKVEYSFDDMLDINQRYREYMENRQECKFIAADESANIVFNSITKEIDKLMVSNV
ncbi:putative Thymidylate_kin domain-containing protein [Vibrio chagasii]|nr:putative Thymidylate_kin domain-containing protein [Vibrio chagasii]CAH7153966.1 putative Thymidylate_kin domain-containing protein [Vibrio chagasii]CAH7446526.1 putative Thymidylate_kin domain-containing protein [Vibrio chagasii]